MHVAVFEKTAEPHAYRYPDEGGVLLSKLENDPAVMDKFANAIDNFLKKLKSHYDLTFVDFNQLERPVGGSVEFADRSNPSRTGVISFKLTNYKYNAETGIFFLFDPR